MRFTFELVADSDGAGRPETLFRLPTEVEVRASAPRPVTVR
ncbi:MAG: hypothetical protein ABW221_26550 [Vicinamibacteria bacterium]